MITGEELLIQILQHLLDNNNLVESHGILCLTQIPEMLISFLMDLKLMILVILLTMEQRTGYSHLLYARQPSFNLYGATSNL